MLPPVVFLSIFNAIAEELVFRLVFMDLLAAVIGEAFVVNFLQSLLYALPHLIMCCSSLAYLAFAYGLLLGWIRQRNHSLFPCIICHFTIDIGYIGLPL
ncbi:CPBP family intramembrane glutamic endopeptidase [Thermodesulfobacteriota bacterium]